MPLSSLELVIKLIVHGGGELHNPLWKNVPKVNVVLVVELGNLRYIFSYNQLFQFR